jgi:lysozyme
VTSLNIIPKVVDLSHYDDLQDIQKVKAAGIVGIVNKASEGPGNVDPTFAIRRPVVLGAGMLYGAYHFLRPGNMAQQAAHFLQVVGDPTGLCLMADWEVPGVSPSDLKVWLAAIHERTGQWPAVYSYASMLLQQLGSTRPDPALAKCRLWVAAYSTHPNWPTQIWSMPWLWQFTGDGNGPGIHQIPGIVLPGSRGIDVDAYEGGDLHGTEHTDEQLRADWAPTDLATNDKAD